MKRIYLWLRELSLTQQLMTIVLLVVSVFAVFMFTFLSPQIDAFTEGEMYRMLHNSHKTTSYYVEKYHVSLPQEKEDDSGILQLMYNPYTDHFLFSKESELPIDLRNEIRMHTLESYTGTNDYIYTSHFSNSKSNVHSGILYCMSRLDGGNYLVSLMPSEYEMNFRTELVNNIVNMNILIAGILFFLLTLWVASLIHPLNQIRAYIYKIKNDEPAELTINRRDEIGEVADALRVMDQQLQKQNREKQEMIQNISHDLKTPIATIKSYGESIKDGIYPYGTLEKSIDVIIEHADRLEKKVRSLIALNKMGYLLDECEEGDHLLMNDVIDKVLLSLKVIRPEITFETDLEKDIYFHGDEDPWRIVVENLVDNALRYAKSTIKISLHRNELIVSNDGSSISEERLEKLFKPYEKGTNGQFGLGLSIVYKVVTTYGYKVEAENLQDGVAFVIYRELSKKELREIHKEKKKENRKILTSKKRKEKKDVDDQTIDEA